MPASEKLFPLVERNVPHAKGKKPLISPDDPRITSFVSAEQWQKLLGLIATGVKQSQAVELLEIDATALEGILRGDPIRHRAWREAIIASDRRGWSVELLEDICALVAAKKGLKAACAEHGKSPLSFLKLVRRDPTIKEMYEEARAIASELEGDDLREIADDNSDDMTLDGKGNTASVNRSKLRVETRLRLMASYNRQRFGEDKAAAAATNVTVNINHADRLESARARLNKARVFEDGVLLEAEPPVEQPARRQLAAPRPIDMRTALNDPDDTAWLD